MKLNRFITSLCNTINENQGCNSCPHVDVCCGTMWCEIEEKSENVVLKDYDFKTRS